MEVLDVIDILEVQIDYRDEVEVEVEVLVVLVERDELLVTKHIEKTDERLQISGHELDDDIVRLDVIKALDVLDEIDDCDSVVIYLECLRDMLDDDEVEDGLVNINELENVDDEMLDDVLLPHIEVVEVELLVVVGLNIDEVDANE